MNCYSTGAGSHSTLVSPLAGLNLDAFHPDCTSYALGPYATRGGAYFYQRPQYLCSSYQYPWVGPSQPKASANALDYTLNWNWPWAPAMNPFIDALPQITYNPFAPQQFNMSDMSSPPSPIDTPASDSPSPAPQRIPLLAPKPLLYHSPKFLQFELPDEDEDLSHPPYIRPAKRKRDDDDEGSPEEGQTKRQVSEDASATSTCHLALRRQSIPNIIVSARRRR
ncbi:hypothetical protein NEOLEDRAFT_1129313 [Neolentinus lepideus HHB14362 ss-1]|uniref:Uncharacterized protein n=1 Tax=Neolentinus lepideus HHB14362 ss-1 TaxID=1314782 RepID=A0A165UPR8_9AGAM|nr:hypothetical protein NEOLEDRAFT_1129313 [Neolentinus lepideus HHB14362 ss-1]